MADSTSTFIYLAGLLAVLFALFQFWLNSLTPIISKTRPSHHEEETVREGTPLIASNKGRNDAVAETTKMREIHGAISTGASAFLSAEYKICLVFTACFAVVVFALISWGENSAQQGFLTMLAFLMGALTSMLSGYIGMKVAVFSNVRTTINAQTSGYMEGFNAAFRAGGVVGFALTGLGLLVLYSALLMYSSMYERSQWNIVMDCIAGFGLGGSSIALFGRVGGGIYTKAADVGADLVGKVVHGIPEDSPKNPAVIADLVGDNVGDIAGMGADLFGSFAESTCAVLVIASQNQGLIDAGWAAICFPLIIAACGVFVCFLTSFLATHLVPVRKEADIELALRLQLVVSTFMMFPIAYIAADMSLPSEFTITGVSKSFTVTSTSAFVCVISGTIGGLLNGLFTEYYTSKDFAPVKELAHSCLTGASTNIIYGLALGYMSVVAPVISLATVVYISFSLADLYGVALAAVGMLATLATCLTIDGFGPVSDNAGGIAEMAELPPEVREKTDALDAAGNTTAAIGKGFAIGSAALVSLALYGAFVTRIQAKNGGNLSVFILQPMTCGFLLVGSALPFWFSAMTMKSVAQAAMKMIVEVERQFKANPDLLNPESKSLPDYARCVAISTQASLAEMIAPGALVMLAPLVVGTFFGVYAVFGMLTGALLTGVQLATSMSNTGGAWDNAKKYISASSPTSEYGGKGSDAYKAAVVGDTVGDPMKDTSGPSLNILMKLMAIISLVFAEYFWAINDGRGAFSMPVN